MLPLCFINPGDVALVTIPGYPVLATHTKYLGGEVVSVPLAASRGFHPDLNAIDPAVADRAKLFYINYPNNPTGAAPTNEMFDALIAFAQKHNVLLVQDAAYATLVYDREPLSICSRPGGKEVSLELHSMSKSYNMTGWRLGFVAGCAKAVQAFSTMKDNIDSGQFKAIQDAAGVGIDNRELSESIRSHYERRLRKLVKVLQAVGFEAQMPGGSFFLYVSAPKGAKDVVFTNAEDASQYLITACSISTVPWDDVGAFLRFSATFEAKDEAEEDHVIQTLHERLEKLRLVF